MNTQFIMLFISFVLYYCLIVIITKIFFDKTIEKIRILTVLEKHYKTKNYSENMIKIK